MRQTGQNIPFPAHFVKQGPPSRVFSHLGESLPRGRRRGRRRTPICGGTPQRPESESADGFAVTGLRSRERLAAPVAEIRDVQRYRSRRSGSDRASLYDEITTKIIGELEAGRAPWVQPWGTAAAKAPLAMPKNAATGRQYSGINVLILWGSVIEYGFPVQGWVTFRQALSLGGNVRKGESGTTVVYADRFIPDDEKKRARETGEEAQAIPFLKRFTVFNLAQCEGLPDDLCIAVPPPEPGLIEPTVEALIKATGIDFRIGGDRAYYAPAHDYVQVPPPQAYFEPINWHRTALHELGHASGAPHRLNRDLSGSFGSKKYAFEELVAEVNAAFCCASLGIAPTVRHADYIGSWLEVLREALWPRAQASQDLPTPVGPHRIRLSCASIHAPAVSRWNSARSRPRGAR